MPARHHSRVFTATRTVRQQIMVAASLPAHPVTALAVATDPQLINQDMPDEWVTVINEVGDDASIRWVTFPTGRNEEFTLRVVVSTRVPGTAWADVEDRLEELADVVQSLWFDPSSGVFTPPPFDGVITIRGVEQVSYVVWPTDEGFAGQAELVLGVTARI